MSMSKSNSMLSPMNSTVMDLPSPSSITYLWNFGSLLGLCLVIQMITGMFLAMHYCSDLNMAFSSMIHISSDMNYGFLLKAYHANGASLFFICVYIHMGSGLYYGSYLKKNLWFSGMVMFAMMMLTAFMGYVLPWGQMSFWGATVMTNFLSAMPYMGNDMVQWVWGGFSVSGATLNSFYSLHYLFPFVLMGLVMIHLVLLHSFGSSNPFGVNSNIDKTQFHPFFMIKDMYGFLILLILLLILMFFYPNVLGDPENFMKANSLVTPTHIMPEWYFLFAYAMLSAIPNKLGGVLALVFSMLILFTTPFFHTSKMNSSSFKPLSKFFYWVFITNFILLTWIGSKPVEEPFMLVGLISSIMYFSYFILITPMIDLMENKILFNQ